MVQPSNDLDKVRALARQESNCGFYTAVLAELKQRNWDSDDLRTLLEHELGVSHCHRTAPTHSYHPGTMSDYYRIWVDEFGCLMFLKLLISNDGRLWVTSFRKEDQI